MKSSRLVGIILLASFSGSLQFVLEHGQQDGWFNNPLIVALVHYRFFWPNPYMETIGYKHQ
jgi:hypothetical protein